ncbi:hypothetical protein [Azomonas macrocytogenes]|uniref:PRTRC genetic system protein E n=1 Tax=Azomonas macrocytogenes TaxID=69962 RepID=A0A839T731_AZOMA|nr:hypothetical protein [Azomonas macrocytogenes]MBB3105262.1 PRTRC genetic system protein E [Azomonas macrocytogenes]
MSDSFFAAISQAVNGTDRRIHIDLQGLADGRIKVLLSADLGPTPDTASNTEVQLRAALAKPLLVSGTPAEVEAALSERVCTHTAALNEGTRLLDEIRVLGSQALADAKKARDPKPKALATQNDATNSNNKEANLPSVQPEQASSTDAAEKPTASAVYDDLGINF